MKKRVSSIILLFLILLFSSTACHRSLSAKVPPKAVKGVLDLRGWDFLRDGSVPLDGEWEFYWKRLLSPNDISNTITSKSFVLVAKSWHKYSLDGKALPRSGYATFKLTLYLPTDRHTYGLYLDGQRSAYRLLANGLFLAGDGRVGKNRQATIPYDKPKVAFLPTRQKRIELVMQVANFHHRYGGFHKSIILGRAETIHHQQLRDWFVESLSMGILAIMGLYSLFFYGFRTKDQSPLFFGLLCWILAIRTGITNQNILLDFLPALSWSLRMRIEYLTFFLGVPSFALFFRSLFPQDVAKGYVQFSVGLGIIFSVFMLLTDSVVYSYTTDYYQGFILLQVFYAVFVLIQIVFRQRESAFLIFLGCLVLFVTVILDILYYKGFFPIANTTPFGFLAFVFVQAVILSKRFSKAFFLVETLTDDLRIANEDLELRVRKRTADLHQAKEAAKQSTLTAEAANRAKSSFLANISHELRTPLNAVLGFANIMAKSKTLSPDDKKNLGTIRRSGQYLLTLINDVLDLSRIEAGKVVLNENNFDLHNLLTDLELMFEQRIQKKGIQAKFIRNSDVPRQIKADQVKLRQVLINLIGNAIKFTTKGGITVTVNSQHPSTAIKKEVRPITLFFEVKDTGLGIAKADLDNIFNPFIQTGTCKESHEGTGLGLSISRRFAQLLGGDITVGSDVGKGSVFRFHIQAYEAKGVDLYPAKPNQPVLGLAPNQPKYRILIVDDISTNRQLLKNISETLGFDIREAENGKESIDIWRNWQPHLIWMDMRMPVMDGYGATRKIKGSAGEEEPVIIALTASAFEEQKEKVLAAGCDDILLKPFKETDIIEMTQKHLNVKFLYAADEIPAENPNLKNDKFELTPSDFFALPQELFMRFKTSVGALEMDLALNIIEEIREQNQPLADALQKLVEEYRFDKLQKLLDQIYQSGKR